MIKIRRADDRLVLEYTPDRYSDCSWVDRKLEESSVTFRRTFSFSAAQQLVDGVDDDERHFVLGVSAGDYFLVDREILDLKHDLKLAKDLPITLKTFMANRDISVFRRIDQLVDEAIVVGGEADSSIPLPDFEELLRSFPTTTELDHYARSRISRVLKDYLGTMSDARKSLESYFARRQTRRPPSRIKAIEPYEIAKFEFVRAELKKMLVDPDAYTEKNWQTLIVDFLLLIFPKYIAVLENLRIKDFYSHPTKGGTNRFIDLTLLDSNGSLDVVEIKKPFANCLLSTRKYRDNYTPKQELSGAVMQAEKYIFHLNKWGVAGEREISSVRSSELPVGLQVKITNPKAMIILGRDSEFNAEQKFDFEIIRRKYGNVMDIMTYDDLLRRLENIICMISRRASGGSTV